MYKVILTQDAYSDLESIIDFISAASLSRALKFEEKLSLRINSLATNPERCRYVYEVYDFNGDTSYRELLVSHYRIIFKLAKKEIFILGFLDTRRNLFDIINQRYVKSKF